MKIYFIGGKFLFEKANRNISDAFKRSNTPLMKKLKISIPELYERNQKKGSLELFAVGEEKSNYYLDFRAHNTPNIIGKGESSYRDLTPQEQDAVFNFIQEYMQTTFSQKVSKTLIPIDDYISNFKKTFIDILDKLPGIINADGLFELHYRIEKINGNFWLRESKDNPPSEWLRNQVKDTILPQMLDQQEYHVATKFMHGSPVPIKGYVLKPEALDPAYDVSNSAEVVPAVNPNNNNNDQLERSVQPSAAPSIKIQTPQVRFALSPGKVFVMSGGKQVLQCPQDATQNIKTYWAELSNDIQELVILAHQKQMPQRIQGHDNTKCIPVQLKLGDEILTPLLELEDVISQIKDRTIKNPCNQEQVFTLHDLIPRKDKLLAMDQELPPLRSYRP